MNPTRRLIRAAVIMGLTGATHLAGQMTDRPNLQRSLIPQPADVQWGSGGFLIASDAVIRPWPQQDAEVEALGAYLSREILDAIGIELRVSPHQADSGTQIIRLRLTQDVASEEGYRLRVTLQEIDLAAASHAGLFYGIQTLRQLLPGAAGVAIPAVEINDAPRFTYRGMHLDVGRHSFPVTFIKKYIDVLATFKMNTFHWHLTEDQGWRVEIKRYPRLTEIGAYRRETILEQNFDPYVGDGEPYGGFYTQDQIREVVRYARDRYVTIIPEIEMPGHSTAALAAYPELACTEGPFEVATTWGVHDDIYCPSERTFTFLEGVLEEIVQLFPGRYVHIGGDEAPKTRWQDSPVAQDVIRREALADEHELQSYFIRRIEGFLLQHDRRIIGWDEILDGGLAPEATVMSWRGMTGGIAAAKQGHDVIMTPTSHVYFDYYQADPSFEPLAIGGFTPLETVYRFEPVPPELTSDEAKHILGAQGNVWTEYMKTSSQVEYMVLPRLLALAEVVWSPQTARDWESFKARLPGLFALLDRMNLNYRVPSEQELEDQH